MLSIGEVYLQNLPEQTRLCADISADGRGTTLWFGLEPDQAHYLCAERSDAFVMALLPMAMRRGSDIHFQTPMSRRLRYQLENYLVPTLAGAGDLYHPIRLHGPVTDEPVKNEGAVGTGFTGGVDSLYTIMTHGADSDYPVTHLAVFNAAFFGETKRLETFRRVCRETRKFAEEMQLNTVFLDNNLADALPERMLDVYSFRNIACAMALQGLFSQYLLSSGGDVSRFQLDLRESSRYDMLTISCAQTDSLAIHWSGSPVKRFRKLEELADWEPAQRWLHSCMRAPLGASNCGNCLKCVRDLCSLYAQDNLEKFSAVYDIPAFYKALPQRFAVVLSNPTTLSYRETLDAMKERGKTIPAISYRMAEQFLRAEKNVKGNQT